MDARVIKDMDSLPPFVRLRDMSGALPKDSSLVVLESDGKVSHILVAPDKFGGHDMLQARKILTGKGFTVEAHRCDPEILSALKTKDVKAREVSDAHGDSDAIAGFDEIVALAVEEKASDIHFERRDTVTTVKMRLFGEMFPMKTLANDKALNIVRVGLTVLGDEGNKPQTFSISEMQQASITRFIEEHGVTVKLRAQTFPAYTVGGDGQDVIMRVLVMSGARNIIEDLTTLGYFPEQVEILEYAKSAPSGALVIAGETGSGKSTTLDNLVRKIIKESGGRIKVITVEHPAEYIINGSTQLLVAESTDPKDNTFTKSMRAAMRGDPDVIMVGEVRDDESAQLAQRMVLSGHPVLTTVHTVSAIKIPIRFADLGVPLSVIASPGFFSALVYQQLLQVVCPKCSTPYLESDLFKEDTKLAERLIRVTGNELDGIRMRHHGGCDHCAGRGIVGREVCAEVISPTYKMLEFFRNEDEIGAIRYWRGDTGIAKTSLGAAVRKMVEGRIDPLEFESGYGKGGIYLRELDI